MKGFSLLGDPFGSLSPFSVDLLKLILFRLDLGDRGGVWVIGSKKLISDLLFHKSSYCRDPFEFSL